MLEKVVGCDRSYCYSKIKEAESYIGWWVVIPPSENRNSVIIRPMQNIDFADNFGGHYCGVDHLLSGISSHLANIQQKIHDATHGKIALEELPPDVSTDLSDNDRAVAVIDEVAAKYGEDPAP